MFALKVGLFTMIFHGTIILQECSENFIKYKWSFWGGGAQSKVRKILQHILFSCRYYG